jgi:23S rRNA pseudouridine2457 synthase
MALQYYCFHKPFRVMSQFSPEGDKATLADFLSIPTDVYPIGRLDFDSEGLLLLTNDRRVNHRLLHPSFAHERTYWVQVEGEPSSEAIHQLESGVTISVNGKTHASETCQAVVFTEAPPVHPRHPPVRYRASIPTTWISLTMQEGKNRQVRKMTAAIGHPTLRLIRYRMEEITLSGLAPGEFRELDQRSFYQQLHLS